VLLGWGGLLGATTAALWRGPTAGRRRLAVTIAWSLSLPWIVIPLNMPMAEHRLYGVMLGLCLLAVALLPRAHLAARKLPFASMRWQHAAFGGLLLLGIGMSAARSLEYRDERILWRNVVAREPSSFRAWWGLGSAIWRYGDVAAAIEPLARAHLLCPAHYEVLANYAEALISLPDAQAQPFRALLVSDRLASRASEDAWARTLQVQARLQAGRATHEREYFEEAERQALSCPADRPAEGLRLPARGRGSPRARGPRGRAGPPRCEHRAWARPLHRAARSRVGAQGPRPRCRSSARAVANPAACLRRSRP
jgi:tetratricopeptide (TPR) repeat protein